MLYRGFSGNPLYRSFSVGFYSLDLNRWEVFLALL